MSYVHINVVRTAWGTEGISSPDSEPGIDDSKLQEAIDTAEAEINSFLCNRYEVPFEDGSVPRFIQIIAKRLAIFFLKCDIDESFSPIDIEGRLDGNYRIQISRLKDLRDGGRDLVGVPEKEATGYVEEEDKGSEIQGEKMDIYDA
jgi:phage gp36-like protein